MYEVNPAAITFEIKRRKPSGLQVFLIYQKSLAMLVSGFFLLSRFRIYFRCFDFQHGVQRYAQQILRSASGHFKSSFSHRSVSAHFSARKRFHLLSKILTFAPQNNKLQ